MTTEVSEAERAWLVRIIAAIEPGDDVERRHLRAGRAWAAGGADLYRRHADDVPPMHLVTYAVPWHAAGSSILLGAHRKAGLWLPPGGHVAPGEHPWDAVTRECREQLGITARAPVQTGPHPVFFTITRTRRGAQHTDVALWYLVDTGPDEVAEYDHGAGDHDPGGDVEFSAVRWFTIMALRQESGHDVEPHLGRFLVKLASMSAWHAT